ncbi:SLAP domain-containing protein [Psychrobacillus glaciei]|uniref:SLAP domain-containing protein n=1 Tax=Psychrobacillus glaciei TaxID=2283160 RepID=A0A5J6SN80_9BACI|nr:SLAP domain-containing protein [Psychrobacillus glaciei]QFF97667.1 SLAP domain-containing protein [Psychrobacillus glaciei]
MQKLAFEMSWDRALSDKDRKEIERIFLHTNKREFPSARLSLIWRATNHKGDLLVTVLVHNFTDEILIFSEKRVTYLENNEVIAENTFTLSTLIIQPNTSMPWTFIFTKDSLKKVITLENGHLEMM